MFGTIGIMMNKIDVILILMKVMFGNGRGAWRRLPSKESYKKPIN